MYIIYARLASGPESNINLSIRPLIISHLATSIITCNICTCLEEQFETSAI